MPLNEDHARFERETIAEIERLLKQYFEVLESAPGYQALPGDMRERLDELKDKIVEVARRPWLPEAD
jgi:hypothetical protein